MLIEKLLDVGALLLNYAQGPPSGPPLLLLHGFTSRWQRFMPLIPSLSPSWHVHALDLPGHGKSGRVGQRNTRADYIADVIAFIERQFSDPAVLIGHSAGGEIALEIAARKPSSVRAVIDADYAMTSASLERMIAFSDAPEGRAYWHEMHELSGSTASLAELVAALTQRSPNIASGLLLEQASTLKHLDPDVLRPFADGQVRAFFADLTPEQTLEKIDCPVLLVQGNPQQGALITDDDAEQMQANLHNSYHVRLEHAGHQLGLDTWEVAPLLRAIMPFLEIV